jgi:hypothetical protein
MEDLMVAILGDELDAETRAGLHEEFLGVRDEVRREQIVFMALRLADDGSERDVMTVAVHGVGSAPPVEPPRSAERSGSATKVSGETVESVSAGGREAIVHASSESAGGAADSGDPGSWAQVVVLLSSGEGAAVTMTSTATGREDELRAEGLEVASSLALVPDAPVEA